MVAVARISGLPLAPPSTDEAGAAGPVNRIQAELAGRIGRERFELWFEGKTRWTAEGEVVEVAAGNAFAAKWIRAKFSDDLRAAASAALGRAVEVRVVVIEEGAIPARQEGASTWTGAGKPQSATWVKPQTVRQDASASLSCAKFSLDEFVVGTCNQLAYRAAVQVAENPGKQFNPLFIHGASGLGKTHLVQGICQRFMKLHPQKKWLYLTGEQFTNEFLEAIRAHKTDAFRRRIRGADLLVIDDVHFLANKKATQEEFLHTFNQIDTGGKQVVLASDCPPKGITAMADSLVNRFVSGMVLRVDTPDLPTRLEILRRRVAKNHWRVADVVLMHIATQATANVRELEGMLLQAVAGVSLGAAEGAGSSENVIAGIQQRDLGGRGPVAVDRILAVTAEHFDATPAGLLGNLRHKTLSLARAVAMYLARTHTGMSFPEIGRAMGNKNHSTVIAACQRVGGMAAAGDVVSWKAGHEARHQAMADLVHELESLLRRGS